jgi:hypothetical protein
MIRSGQRKEPRLGEHWQNHDCQSWRVRKGPATTPEESIFKTNKWTNLSLLRPLVYFVLYCKYSNTPRQKDSQPLGSGLILFFELFNGFFVSKKAF